MLAKATRWRVGIQVLATMYQYITAGFLLFGPEYISLLTPLHRLTFLVDRLLPMEFENLASGLSILVAAVCATISLMGNGRMPWPLRLFLLIPQQYVLVLILVGSLSAIRRGQYVSGFESPWVYMAADESLLILLCVMYTVAVAHDIYLRVATHSLRTR